MIVFGEFARIKPQGGGSQFNVAKLVLNRDAAFIAILYLLYYCLAIVVLKFGVTYVFLQPLLENGFSIAGFGLSVISLLCVSIFLSRKQTPANFFIHIIIGFIYVPTLVIYTVSALPFSFCLMTLFACLVVVAVASFVRIPAVKLSGMSVSMFNMLCLVCSLCVIFNILIISDGLAHMNFSFADVYTYRMEFRDLFPASLTRAISIISKVLIPFRVVICLIKRNWIVFGLYFFLSVLMFGITSHKSIMFYPFATLAVYLVLSFARSWVVMLIYGLLAIVAISGIESIVLPAAGVSGYTPWFTSLFFRRVLLVPSILDFYYFDYFNWHNMVYWAGNKLVTLGFVPAQPVAPTYQIGTYFFGRTETSANVGFIGSGFSNMGVFGVFIYSVLTGLVLSMFNSYAKLFGNRLTISVALVPVITLLISSDFFITLLTHGLLAVFLCLALLDPGELKTNDVSVPQPAPDGT